MREKLAILISGGGTTMAEIIKAQQSGFLDLDIACIISSRPDADGLNKAKDLGIPPKDILTITPKPREDFAARLLTELQLRDVSIVSQNGWLPLTPPEVISAYNGRVFNQHPGNPHLFGGKGMYGLTVHQAAINFYQATGKENHTHMIVQEVAKNFDQGEVLVQTPVEILSTDTAKTLQERCLPVEHQTVIGFLKDFLSGTLKRVNLTNLEELTPSDKETLIQCRQKAISLNLNN